VGFVDVMVSTLDHRLGNLELEKVDPKWTSDVKANAGPKSTSTNESRHCGGSVRVALRNTPAFPRKGINTSTGSSSIGNTRRGSEGGQRGSLLPLKASQPRAAMPFATQTSQSVLSQCGLDHVQGEGEHEQQVCPLGIRVMS
jgi:hypothetical protein